MTEQPTLQDIADKVDDLGRLLSRQSAGLAALTTDRAAVTRPDTPLLVELHALHTDALACAGTAGSEREAAAFTALADGLERLLAGRGGLLVRPSAGERFDSATMDASRVDPTDDPELERTVVEVLAAGLAVEGRSVRPARVAVLRRPRPSTR